MVDAWFQEFAKLVAAFVTGGTAVAMINSRMEKKKLIIADKDDLLTRVNEILKKCENDKERLTIDILSNQRRITELDKELQSMRRTHLDICMPTWRTTMDHRVVNVNDAAVTMIFEPMGMSREEVIGLMDVELWEDKVCHMFLMLDREALLSPMKSARVYNTFLHKNLPEFDIIRYVTHVDDQTTSIGFINYVVPSNMNEHPAERLVRQLIAEEGEGPQ